MRKKNTTDDIHISEIPLDEERPGRKKKARKENKAKKKKASQPKGGGQAGYQDAYQERKKRNRELVRVSYLIVAMFLSLAVYLVYFNVYRIDEINSNSYNTKQDSKQEMIIRGSILSADGEILAGTNVDADGNETRLYPFDNVFSHVVGYASNGRPGWSPPPTMS